jgi:apolipoprotein N-acyltransferase
MHEPLVLDIGRVGALICFESAFPELARDYRAQGADLVVNLTNDAVLGAGRGPAQHLAHLAVRAVEARVAVIQAANSGISAYADPRGVLLDPTPRDTALVRAYDVSATSAASLYVAVGDWLGLTSALGAALLAMAGLRARRRAHG